MDVRFLRSLFPVSQSWMQFWHVCDCISSLWSYSMLAGKHKINRNFGVDVYRQYLVNIAVRLLHLQYMLGEYQDKDDGVFRREGGYSWTVTHIHIPYSTHYSASSFPSIWLSSWSFTKKLLNPLHCQVLVKIELNCIRLNLSCHAKDLSLCYLTYHLFK